ncbi:MAG TPA: hypothetical protein VGF59_33275 [Bryobacteraceae bacterium]
MFQKLSAATGLLGVLLAAPLAGQNYSRFTTHMGGGISTPLNPTGAYTGVSGNFDVGAGYNLGKNDAIIGEFMWSGLPTSISAIHPVKAPDGKINLYTLTVNYRHQKDRIHGSPLGVYLVGGGGWYYRYSSLDKNFVVPPGTACQPIYGWWGYGCDTSGYVYSETVAYRGTSAGGVNAGAGFTLRFADSNWKFFTEARYHYAWSQRIPTTLIPVTFGIRFN